MSLLAPPHSTATNRRQCRTLCQSNRRTPHRGCPQGTLDEQLFFTEWIFQFLRKKKKKSRSASFVQKKKKSCVATDCVSIDFKSTFRSALKKFTFRFFPPWEVGLIPSHWSAFLQDPASEITVFRFSFGKYSDRFQHRQILRSSHLFSISQTSVKFIHLQHYQTLTYAP